MESQITVYIDEGGDPGVKDGLRFADTRYEWFTLGAYVVRSANEPSTLETVNTILGMIRGGQLANLHYAQLPKSSRVAVCQYLASRPARGFCLLSHKTNLRQYVSPVLGQLKASEYYNWCTRLLLERIMYWYHAQISIGAVALAPLRIVFSERGGHDYGHMFSYFEVLNSHARRGGFKKPPKHYDPAMMVREHWSIARHESFAGLQLADVIASAFYQAANRMSPNWNVVPAKSLAPIMAEDARGSSMDVGVTVWPLSHQGKLPPDSRGIFSSYGYGFR